MTLFTPEVIDIIIAVLKAVVILLAVVVCGALLSWVERRLLALWQDRYGPNRVGPFGAFQIAADMIKMFFKEDWTPPFADKFIFWLAPAIGRSVGLRGAVRRLVEQQQVRPAGQLAGFGANRVVRSVHGPVADGHRDPGRFVQHARHR